MQFVTMLKPNIDSIFQNSTAYSISDHVRLDGQQYQ